MEVEHDIKVIPVNEGLQGEIEKLAKEGWALVPGVQPVAIYHVVRPKHTSAHAHTPMAAQAAMGTMGIDDTKVFLLRDGKLIPN